MFITMHCGGMPFNGDTIKTRSLGGSETAAYYVAKGLAARGHQVSLFTATEEEGIFDGVRYVNMGPVSNDLPLGANYTFYSRNSPADATIVQRHPLAFSTPTASKVNMLWLHDLALQRMRGAVHSQLASIQKIMCVSQWHVDQVSEVYGIPQGNRVFGVAPNGVDMDLYSVDPVEGLDPECYHLLYSSRPERGLEFLVKAGGVLDSLADSGKKVHLHVCGYDNTTEHMRSYYEYLWSLCDARDNVTHHGSLTKSDLAALQMAVDLHVYPSLFEETSCITAMECAVAGLPMIGCKIGALPETVDGMKGVKLIPVDSGGEVSFDQERFTDGIISILSNNKLQEMGSAQSESAGKFSWSRAVSAFEEAIEESMGRSSHSGRLHTMYRNSDIVAIEKTLPPPVVDGTPVDQVYARILKTYYAFYTNNRFADHYQAYYDYEKSRGVEYGPEDITGNSRFRAVANLVSEKTSPGDTILDYGCAHGHYTVTLAASFPDRNFIGIDLEQTNIGKAKAWAQKEGVSNAKFLCGDVHDRTFAAFCGQFSMVIAAEVIEHVGDPVEYLEYLHKSLQAGGHMVITTPYGPWEWQGYRQHDPWRAHLHHFEKADIHELFGSLEGFSIAVVPSGVAPNGEPVGSFVYTYVRPDEALGRINYARKYDQTVGQSMSVCMIVRNGEESLIRCLRKVVDIADQIVIGVDKTTDDRTWEVITNFIDEVGPFPTVDAFEIESPLATGFDHARNLTVDKAWGDWVFWIDHDEVLDGAHNIRKYLVNNCYEGYLIPQHHVANDPVGVLKTDYPVRLFRRNGKIKFVGMVHEHPEVAQNEGVGFAVQIGDVKIIHHGYEDETVRRGRFQRNLSLLAQDREKNPDRILGKFLWMRDLAQMNRFDMEKNGGHLTDQIMGRAQIGLDIFDDIIESANPRMMVDGLEFASQLAATMPNSISVSFMVAADRNADAPRGEPVSGRFKDIDTARRYIDTISSITFDRWRDTRYM